MILALLITMGSPALLASATEWFASTSAPLYVAASGSTARTYGSWDAYRADSSTAKSVASATKTAYYKYTDANDHKVYMEMGTTLSRYVNGSWTNSTYTTVSTEHANWVLSSWKSYSVLPKLSPLYLGPKTLSGSVEVSADFRVCLDLPMRFDQCSASKTIRETVNY